MVWVPPFVDIVKKTIEEAKHLRHPQVLSIKEDIADETVRGFKMETKK